MLEHLISHELDPVVCPTGEAAFVGLSPTRHTDVLSGELATTTEVISAQVATADWLEEAGLTAAQVAPEAAATTARTAFAALTTAPDTDSQREALMALHMPEQVRHVVGMLTAYDWEFVHQAQQMRAYVVTKLMEETQNPKAEVRLKALGMLGKVTEVGLFTDKVEVKKTDMSDEEINTRIKDKIAAFLKIEDATVVGEIEDASERPASPQ